MSRAAMSRDEESKSAADRTLLSGDAAVVVDWDGPVLEDGAVVWSGERIEAVGDRRELIAAYPEARRVDAAGGVVVPGLINLHHHFYSAFARGLDPGVAMANFPEVLDRLWWRLDRALDSETVALSAELALVDCIRWGCTTVFDHHASPSAIDGSLDRIADAVEQAGLSALLCYEITDRNGKDGAAQGLRENSRFIDSRRKDPRIRGVMGLHANFTLTDPTLESVARDLAPGVGCHIHLAEDPADGSFTQERFGEGLLGRLDRFGLLDGHSLLAHCIHLDGSDYRRIAAAGATILHNPESNANNGVGRLDPQAVQTAGCAVGLGTDGMSGNMLRSLRVAFLLHRHARLDPSAGFDSMPGLFETNTRLARRFFDEPQLGRLEVGAPADLAVLDGSPPTPLQASNVFGHLIYGLAEARVRHTIARGRLLMRDFEVLSLDAREVAHKARAAAPAVWGRFHGLEWGTPYLGGQ